MQDTAIQTGSTRSILALQLAKGDLAAARATVNVEIQQYTIDPFWEVADMDLALREQGLPSSAISAGSIQRLQQIAGSASTGRAQAQAWLNTVAQGAYPRGDLFA